MAILVSGAYVWATYLRLEHYLLVPWLVLGIGATVASRGHRAGGLGDRPPTRAGPSGRSAGRVRSSGLPRIAFAIGLAGLNFGRSDRSADRSGDEYVDAVLAALPPDAAILSYWDASTPLWHAAYVEGRRPDVLIVDDTNIVYDGWGTRENRIASLVCERPVFVLRADPRDYQPMLASYRLSRLLDVRVGVGGPSAAVTSQVYRVEPRDPAACGG